MNVSGKQRKDATLLMLSRRKIAHENGDVKTLEVTAYTVAAWHGMAQSSIWRYLQHLISRRLVKRYESHGKSVIIKYALTRRGQTYVNKHRFECVAGQTAVLDWKMEKYQRGFPW